MSEGWIKLYRQIRDHAYWLERRRFSRAEAWIDLLMSASHKDHDVTIGGRIINLKRGQVLTSQVALAQRWGWKRIFW